MQPALTVICCDEYLASLPKLKVWLEGGGKKLLFVFLPPPPPEKQASLGIRF